MNVPVHPGDIEFETSKVGKVEDVQGSGRCFSWLIPVAWPVVRGEDHGMLVWPQPCSMQAFWSSSLLGQGIGRDY
jgi:hypothetical protein